MQTAVSRHVSPVRMASAAWSFVREQLPSLVTIAGQFECALFRRGGNEGSKLSLQVGDFYTKSSNAPRSKRFG
jgi:hypothetical protein